METEIKICFYDTLVRSAVCSFLSLILSGKYSTLEKDVELIKLGAEPISIY